MKKITLKKNNRKIKAFILICIGIIFVFFINRYVELKKDRDTNLQSKVNLNVEKKITLKGQIVDLSSDEGLSGVSISYQDFSLLTDDNGQFTINNVNPNDSITISGRKVYSKFEVPVEGRTEIKILVDKDLYSLLADVEKLERERKYFQIYSLLSNKISKRYSPEVYVGSKNQWRDNIVDSHSYNFFNMNFKKDHLVIVKNSNGVQKTVETTAVYQWGRDNVVGETYNLPIVFELTSAGWELSSSLLW